MRVLSEAMPLNGAKDRVCLAMGVFDGVHRGHVAVISRMLEDARVLGAPAVVVTFDRHPGAVLCPDRAPLMIYPLWRRLAALESLGVETALVFRFDLEFSRQPAETFLIRLIHGFRGLASVSVGNGFVFGYQRRGDLGLLARMGGEHDFRVHGIPALEWEGVPVSSTRLRERVAEGQLNEAGLLLGRPYGLAGEVVGGERLGRKLGFPTANLDVRGLVLPPNGVYAAVAQGSGWRRAAAVNIGRRPTVAGAAAETRVEAHIVDFDGDLYGQRLELELHDQLRGERRFESKEALISQIATDVSEVSRWARNRELL